MKRETRWEALGCSIEIASVSCNIETIKYKNNRNTEMTWFDWKCYHITMLCYSYYYIVSRTCASIYHMVLNKNECERYQSMQLKHDSLKMNRWKTWQNSKYSQLSGKTHILYDIACGLRPSQNDIQTFTFWYFIHLGSTIDIVVSKNLVLRTQDYSFDLCKSRSIHTAAQRNKTKRLNDCWLPTKKAPKLKLIKAENRLMMQF